MADVILSPVAGLSALPGNVTTDADLTVGDDLVVTDTLTVTGLASFNGGATFKTSPWFDVKAYGATGDGTTDDATSIQAALTAVPAGGGTVFVPAGTYIIGTALSVKANTLLVGGGAGSVIKSKSTLTSSIIANASSGGSITIRDLTFDGNSVASVKGIWFTNGTLFLVTGCRFSGFSDDPIRFTTLNHAVVNVCQFTGRSVTVVSSNYCVVIGCEIINPTAPMTLGTGGATGGATPTTRSAIIDCTFDGGTGGSVDHIYIDLNSSDNVIALNVSRSSPRYGIIVDQSPRNLVVGNIITSSANYGIFLTNNTSDGASSRNQVIENHIRSAGTAGILAQGASGSALLVGVVIHDNLVELSGEAGIDGNYLNDSSIDGNTVELSQQHGIRLNNSANCSIQANHIRDSSQATNNTYDQIHMNPSSACIIANNSTRETQGNKAARGFQEAGSSNSNFIAGNYFSGMVGAAVVTVGAATVKRENFGLVASGATSVADGGTITHGLSATPTIVRCTPSVASEMVSVTGLAATTFTVAIKKHDNSAGTTQTVYWEAEV